MPQSRAKEFVTAAQGVVGDAPCTALLRARAPVTAEAVREGLACGAIQPLRGGPAARSPLGPRKGEDFLALVRRAHKAKTTLDLDAPAVQGASASGSGGPHTGTEIGGPGREVLVSASHVGSGSSRAGPGTAGAGSTVGTTRAGAGVSAQATSSNALSSGGSSSSVYASSATAGAGASAPTAPPSESARRGALTPVQIAALHGHMDVFMLLCRAGADVVARASAGWRAVDLAFLAACR